MKPETPVKLKEKPRGALTIEEPSAQPVNNDDPTGWKAAERFIGMFTDAPEGEPLAREHDKHIQAIDEHFTHYFSAVPGPPRQD